MGLCRFEDELLDQARLRIGIGREERNALRCLPVHLVPVDEVVGLVRVRPTLRVTIDIGQRGHGNAMALVRHQLAEGLHRVIRPPLGELRAVNLCQQLADGLAKGQR